MLLCDISFDFSYLIFLNFALIFALPDFFAFAWVAFFSVDLPSKYRSYPKGLRQQTDLFLIEICLSTDSWLKDVIKLKFSWIERESEYPLKYHSFSKSWCICWPHRFIVTPLITIYLPSGFLNGGGGGGITAFKVQATMSWSLSLSGDWISRNWPWERRDNQIQCVLFSCWEVH